MISSSTVDTPLHGNVERGKTSHNDELLPQAGFIKSAIMETSRIFAQKTSLGETPMQFLISIPAAFGTMAVMVAFFMIATR
jgi:hypothetical protein